MSWFECEVENEGGMKKTVSKISFYLIKGIIHVSPSISK